MARNFGEHPCISCGEVHRIKSMKKILKKYYCKPCAAKNRSIRREETIEQMGIKEELNELKRKEMAGYNKLYKKPKKVHQKAPKRVKTLYLERPEVKNSARKKNFFRIPYLTKSEKEFLWKKYIKIGMSNEEAKQRLEDYDEFQTELYHKLKAEKKSESEINLRFKQAFWELCQEAI